MDTRYAEPRDIPARMHGFCDWLNADESLALPIAELVSVTNLSRSGFAIFETLAQSGSIFIL